MTGSTIDALTAHVQTLLSCLKHTALDRLRVRLNVTSLTVQFLQQVNVVRDAILANADYY